MKDAPQQPSFKAALRFWCKLGWISFGGTAAHIAIMHDELVEKKQWISNRSFLHALSHCMILPGPEAQQLAIYIGWKLHGKRGGILAGTLFVLPSMFILLALRRGAIVAPATPKIQTEGDSPDPTGHGVRFYSLFPGLLTAIHEVPKWAIRKESLGCLGKS